MYSGLKFLKPLIKCKSAGKFLMLLLNLHTCTVFDALLSFISLSALQVFYIFQKVLLFFLFLHNSLLGRTKCKNSVVIYIGLDRSIHCGYSLEAPH